MNWTVLIIFGIVALALIIFLVVRNQKDEKDFEKQVNNDYHKTKDEEGDVQIDEETK
jgi:FtsZ-interacting cell division protein ZipA